jgi:uncharacterized glyoxalase superfamily protein PhnB
VKVRQQSTISDGASGSHALKAVIDGIRRQAMPGTARLFGYYSYRNASHAIDWLIQAFGFERVRQQDGPDGAVLHAELRLGDVVMMVASADADYIMPPLVGRSTGHGAYLLVDDVDGIYARALASGATSVVAPS